MDVRRLPIIPTVIKVKKADHTQKHLDAHGSSTDDESHRRPLWVF
jgi:hypothetical protein